jgi:hypothetical protein
VGISDLAFSRIIHFVLFVIGCIETNKRNRMPRTVYVMQPFYGPSPGMPAAYHQLGAYPPPPPQGQPMPQHQMYTQPPPGQMPAQPPPTLAADAKTGAERFA